MTDHPLTDDILINKFLKHARKFNSYTFDYTSDGMRAAYDKGRNDQLEQVIEWLLSMEHFPYVTHLWDHSTEFETDELIADLKKAMRPQQQENY